MKTNFLEALFFGGAVVATVLFIGMVMGANAAEVVVDVPEGQEVRLVPVGTSDSCVEVKFVPLARTSGAFCADPVFDPYDPNHDGVMEWQSDCRYDPCNPDAPVVCPDN